MGKGQDRQETTTQTYTTTHTVVGDIGFNPTDAVELVKAMAQGVQRTYETTTAGTLALQQGLLQGTAALAQSAGQALELATLAGIERSGPMPIGLNEPAEPAPFSEQTMDLISNLAIAVATAAVVALLIRS
jgi:hypothetical protein